MTPDRRYQRRDARQANPKPIRLTERDLDILQMVYDCRWLTTAQIQTLFFPSKHRAYERLAALYHHGYLQRRPLENAAGSMNSPLLYELDRQGAAALRHHRGLVLNLNKQSELTPFFLNHALAINDVRVAVTAACAADPALELIAWRDERALKADYDYVRIREGSRSQRVSIIPDGYFVLATTRGYAHFCLELDRATMDLKRFKTKLLAYQEYYRSGGYEKRYGTKSLRMLTITIGAERLHHLRELTAAVRGQRRFWFTTLDTITPASVLTQPIWYVATDPTPQALWD